MTSAPPEKAVGEPALASLDDFLAASNHNPREVVLGMVGFFGQPEPVQWLILTADPAKAGVLRESVFARGKILAERAFTPLPGQDLPHLPLVRKTLKIDSAAAFRIAEGLARQQKRSFDSVHFQLRVRDLENEPVWMLNFISPAQISIGVVYLSASSGKVLRESWAAIPATGVSAR
ncbi:MAG: hypothetical protein KA152_17265 [Verrucomicrobiales bacterium]|nr:hypothetical protein [Verrucomicrobiales bacterium]